MPSYYVVKNGQEVEVTEAEFNAYQPEPAPAPRDQPDVAQVKTESSSEQKNSAVTTGSTNPDSTFETTFNNKDSDKFLAAAEKNILHNYRSWTYNFAFGALTPKALSNPALLEHDIRTYTVLNSAGKGTAGMGVDNGGLNRNSTDYQSSKKLVDGFNASSPGRFDMFIDDVSIDSTMGSSKEGGNSIATNIGFTVFEPYSMNGFIEALQAAAKAAGYSDYMKAVFALRVQFQGYPDTATNAQMVPEIIPKSTRFFTLNITEVDVDVSESGTRYKVNAVPAVQMALGISNKLTSDIKVVGDTVGEVLKNFFEGINQMVTDRTKKQTDQVGRDKYEISCPGLATPTTPQNTKAAVLKGTTSTGYTSEIINSKMVEEFKSSEVFRMGDPAAFKNGYVGQLVEGKAEEDKTTANPSTGKLTPKENTVVFAQGSNIHDCISAVVRDSMYTRDLLKPESLNKAKKGNGEIIYFAVRMEVEVNEKDYDEVNNTYFSTYRYVLEPYKMHYSRIPGQEMAAIDFKNVKAKIKREYNYIYTGKNEDITKFALKFDNLYYNAIPAMMGSRPATSDKSQAQGPGNKVDVKTEKSEAVAGQKEEPPSSAPMTSQRVDPDAGKQMNSGAQAGLPQGDPYALLAKNLHNAVLNNVALVQGSLDIFGDPYFLVTGGMNNGDLALKEPMMTTDGQAPTTQGDVYVNINFRNPNDIDPNTGLVDFGKDPVSFSGVYRIIELKSNFKDGVFTQSLQILRMAGQIVGKGTEKLASNGKTLPQVGQQLVKDIASAAILKAGIRPSDFNLANLLSRGLPSTGLPGSVSNFTNAVSGAVSGVLNQVSGVAGAANNLTSQFGVSPVGGINQLTSGIRLAASGLGSLGTAVNVGAATITAAGAAVGNIANIPGAATKLAGNVVDSITSAPATAVAAANGVLNNITGQASSLVQNVTGLATQSFDKVSGLVGDAKNAITGLQNSIPTDFAAVGAKLGIDPSALAGLSPDLASKLADELLAVAKAVPTNVDLNSLKEQGVAFANLTKDQIANLPASQPKTVAEGVGANPSLEDIAKARGTVSPLLDGKANLPPLTDINSVTNPLGAASAGLNSGFQSAQAVFGSVSAANSYVNNTIGSAVGIANNVGSIAQNTVQGFNPSSVGLGSVESNIINVNNITQASTKLTDMSMSVASQFGTFQASPLDKLVNKANIEGSV